MIPSKQTRQITKIYLGEFFMSRKRKHSNEEILKLDYTEAYEKAEKELLVTVQLVKGKCFTQLIQVQLILLDVANYLIYNFCKK